MISNSDLFGLMNEVLFFKWLNIQYYNKMSNNNKNYIHKIHGVHGLWQRLIVVVMFIFMLQQQQQFTSCTGKKKSIWHKG